jgi:hypothetical protein
VSLHHPILLGCGLWACLCLFLLQQSVLLNCLTEFTD